MKEIKRLHTKKINGILYSYAIFWCDFCQQEVIRKLKAGKKQKSCGCAVNELKSIGNKGKKRTLEQRKRYSDAFKGKKKSEETRQKMRDNHADFSGENHPMYGVHRFGEESPNWSGGISFLPYSPEFNKELKQQILERDNYICQCPDCEHKTDLLDIHHIDYNKQNNSLENFITLCRSCHMKTNGKNKREYFTRFYSSIILGGISI